MVIQNLPASQRREVSSDPSVREMNQRNAVLESSDQPKGQRSSTDDAESFSEHSFFESNRQEEEEEAGFANDDSFVERLSDSIERSKRKRNRKRKRSSSDDLDDDAALISNDPFYHEESKKKTSYPFDEAVFMEPRLKTSSIHESKQDSSTDDQDTSEEQSQEEEEEKEKEGFLLDSVRSNRSSSAPSNEEIAALCLFQLSRDHHKRLSQPQPQTHIQLPKVDSYKCNLCGKEFPSFQALGGHKANHRVKPPRTLVENTSAEDGDKNRPKKLLPSVNIHKCSICHAVFPTGQSLGGHKRSHFHGYLKRSRNKNVSKGDKLSSSSSRSVVTNASDPEQRLEGLIDLNKVPSPEFDESGGRDVNTNRIKGSTFFQFM